MDRTQRTLTDLWSDSKELERAVLERLEQGTLRVPPYPSVALALRKLVSQENYGLDEVLTIVSNDPALVADVLRCANAAFFGRGTVGSVQQAVGRVGASQVTRLALVSGLSGLVRTPGPLAPLRREAWEASLSAAALCQTLAPLRKLSVESAFVAGLLHDFGWLIGISALEEMFATLPAVPQRDDSLWHQGIERCHTQLGMTLAARWNLPPLLCDAIGLHHQDAPQSEFAPFVELVAAADRVLALLESEPTISAATLEKVPRLTPLERQALVDAIAQLPELVSAFDSEPQGTSAVPRVHTLAPAPLPEGFHPCEGQVHQLSPRRRGPFALQGLSDSSLVMKGADALPEKQLVELELVLTPAPLRLWAKVMECRSEAGGCRIECKPFALNGQTLARWRELVAAAARP